MLSDTYLGLLLSTKRGNSHGIFSNAKPIFVISIIDAIEEGVIIGNTIRFDNKELLEIYSGNYVSTFTDEDSVYRANLNITPYNLPFFHLNSEPYYHIKWNDGVVPPRQAQSPSNMYIRKNVDYAYLDEPLWNLLQDSAIREEFKQKIINHYLKEPIQ
jgi:putative restriction endonuclease